MRLNDIIIVKNDRLEIDSTLENAIEQMEREEIGHVVFVDRGEPVGILTLKDVVDLYLKGVPASAKGIEYASYPLITLHSDRPVDMAVERMIDHEIRRIVLIDENESYAGTLTQTDILNFYEHIAQCDHRLFQCVSSRNSAVAVDHTVTIHEAIETMKTHARNVLVVEKEGMPAGIITEKDILGFAYRKIPTDVAVSEYACRPIIDADLNDTVKGAIERMRSKRIHHLLVRSQNDNRLYVLDEKNMVLNYNTSLEVSLESKLRDAKATYNLLGLAFCEIVDLGEKQIIRWLNAEAMLTFGVKIDDPAEKMLGAEIWNKLIGILRQLGGVERERIEAGDEVYEVTLLEAEVNGLRILKLFLYNVSELVKLGNELRRTLEHTIELEQEKSRLYLDVASVMCLGLNEEGIIELINPKGCEILGIKQEEALGKDWFDTYVIPEEAESGKALFREIVSGRREMVEYYENKVRASDGTMRIVAWRNALLKDPTGKVIGTFSSGEDVTKIRESEREIERITHYDMLTKLPNRLLVGARLEHSIERADREQTKLAVLYVDIDNFKDVNESFGYVIGDAIIMQIAEKLGKIVRIEDTIGRIGGDEFIIILESLHDLSESKRILNEILRAFEEESVDTREGDFKLTASIGIAVYPDDAEDAQTLLKNADIALRRAKEAGRNSYCFFAQEMGVQLFERVLMEREMRRAVEEKEFVVYYQPQIDLKTGKVIGAEALVRWKHPALGMVRPDMFIPLAEENNLIIPIGEEVLSQTCRAVRRWNEEGLLDWRVSVNVSGKQFLRPDIVDTIHHIITSNGLKPELIELEITESVLMSNPKVLGEKLITLKELGIEVAIDDFGTGYSSLSYLKTFPIDKLKVDQSFIHGILQDDQDRAIVQAIIAMAHALGLKTIAEGIESPEQGDILREMGCMQAQGYLYARPLEEKAFESFLKKHRND